MPIPITGKIEEISSRLFETSIYKKAAEISAFDTSQRNLFFAAYERESNIDAFNFLPVPVFHNSYNHGVWVLQNMEMIIETLKIDLNPYEAYLLSAVINIHDTDNIQIEPLGLEDLSIDHWRLIWDFRKRSVQPDESADFAINEYEPFFPDTYRDLLIVDNSVIGISRKDVESDLHFLIANHTVRQKENVPLISGLRRGDYEVRLDLLAAITLLADSLQRTTYRVNRDWFHRLKSEGLIDRVEKSEIDEINEFYNFTLEIIGSSPSQSGMLDLEHHERYFRLWNKFKDKAYAEEKPNSAYVARLLMSAYMSAAKDINLRVENHEISLEVTTTIDFESQDFIKMFIERELVHKFSEKGYKANLVFEKYGLPLLKIDDAKVAYSIA